MTTLIWIIAVYVVGIFAIGLPMGKKSLTAWNKWESPKAGLWTRLLFPLTASDGKKPTSDLNMPLLIGEVDLADQESKQRYVGLIGILWPIRLVWSLLLFPIAAITTGLIFALPRLGSMLGKIVKV